MPLHRLHNNLPKSLKQLCGNVQLPQDGRKELNQYLQTHDQTLKDCAVASLRHKQASHAWTIGIGNQREIGDPSMTLSGAGPVEGHHRDLSSSHGELQGQTAMGLITGLLLEINETHIHTTFGGGGQ